MIDVANEKYMSLTTFTKDRRPKPTPVWFAAIDQSRIATMTDEDSWKVKRIRRDSGVTVRACDSRGNVEGDAERAPGQATVFMPDSPEYESGHAKLKQKYGLFYLFFRLMAKLRGKQQCVIVIELSAEV